MNSSSLKESEPFKQELQSILGSILDDYVELQKEAKELREEIRKLRMDYNHLKNIDDTIHKIGRKAGIVQHDDWDKCGDDCCGCMMLTSDIIAHKLYKKTLGE